MRELGFARRALGHAHDHEPERVMADQHAGVHRDRRKSVQIIGKACLAERQPRRARAQIIPEHFDFAGQRRRDRKSAVADDLGGDALAHLALSLGIDRQREIRVGLDVDEAGRDGEAGRVDGFACGIGDVPDRRDAIAVDGKIALDAGIAGAVVKRSAADQDVVHD